MCDINKVKRSDIVQVGEVNDWICVDCKKPSQNANAIDENGEAYLVCNHCLTIIECGQCYESYDPFEEED